MKHGKKSTHTLGHPGISQLTHHGAGGNGIDKCGVRHAVRNVGCGVRTIDGDIELAVGVGGGVNRRLCGVLRDLELEVLRDGGGGGTEPTGGLGSLRLGGPLGGLGAARTSITNSADGRAGNSGAFHFSCYTTGKMSACRGTPLFLHPRGMGVWIPGGLRVLRGQRESEGLRVLTIVCCVSCVLRAGRGTPLCQIRAPYFWDAENAPQIAIHK
jgi:hypothetical protein